ncbi:MAG: YceI family protein [Planctomycetota bacterium]|nr:MAG: YceI family protein [Planctomycetota bacterium]
MSLSLIPSLSIAISYLLMFVVNTQNTASPTPVTTSPVTSSTPAVPGTVWKIDDTHSMGVFRVQHFGAGMFWGRFDGVTGTITTSGTPIENISFNVTIDTNSISSANKDLDGHLRSPDFFSVKEFPEMNFKSTSAKKLEGNMWEVAGTITIHGVTKPHTVQMELTGQSESARGKKIGFEAVFTIDRSEFGMTYGIEKNAIGKNVRIIVALEAAPS